MIELDDYCLRRRKMIELGRYDVSMEEFCLVFECARQTSVVISVPHDTLPGPDFDGLFVSRGKGGVDKHVWPIVKDIMLKTDVHVVRGLMPRRFVEYNIGHPLNENYYPLSQKAERKSLVDERLASQHQFFHEEIKRLLKKAVKANGQAQCLLIDMHGFGQQPVYAPPYGYDLIFGTANRTTIRHGRGLTGREGIDRLLAKRLKTLDYQVFLPKCRPVRPIEDDFSGGYTVRHHSEASEINAIQIEIAKRFRTSDGLESGRKLADDLAGFINELNDPRFFVWHDICDD